MLTIRTSYVMKYILIMNILHGKNDFVSKNKVSKSK